MAKTFSVESELNGRRFADTRGALEALVANQRKNLDDFGHRVADEMRAFINRELETLASRHSGPVTAPKNLARRTSKLVRALQNGGTVKHRGTLDSVRGEVRVPKQYHVHEWGGTLRPKSGDFLFVPLPAALDSRGRPKRLKPRDWHGTFIAESRRGNLLLFQKKRGKPVPLYALKSQVEIPRRMGLRDHMRRGVPAFADRLLEALLDEILKGS